METALAFGTAAGEMSGVVPLHAWMPPTPHWLQSYLIILCANWPSISTLAQFRQLVVFSYVTVGCTLKGKLTILGSLLLDLW